MRRARLVLALALRDLLHERGLALCAVIGLGAVLLPLIVLFGLKNGVIEGMREELVQNPRSRMIVNAANRPFEPGFIAGLAARPGIVFAVGRIRSISADARFLGGRAPDSPVVAELWSTGPGDPLLAGPAPGPREVVLSRSLAAALGAGPGETLTLRAGRVSAEGERQLLNLPVRVLAVAPAASVERHVAFVDPRLLLLVDGFVDRRLPAETAPESLSPVPETPYAGFRAHARRLEDVPALDAALRAEGVEVETRAHEVAALLGLDRSLDLLFLLVAGLGGAGYLVAVGMRLYADVERKRRALSQLRLLGFRRADAVLLPLAQSLLVGLAGAVAGGAAALLAGELVNRLDLAQAGGRAICVIAPWHLALAALATLAGAALAAIAAGIRAGRIAPAEGLRDA